MDKKPKRWNWMPEAMPGVAKMVAERRAKFGQAYVDECWRKGVLELQPGWFFAREGALTVGTPSDDPVMANFAAARVTDTQAFLMMRDPVVRNG